MMVADFALPYISLIDLRGLYSGEMGFEATPKVVSTLRGGFNIINRFDVVYVKLAGVLSTDVTTNSPNLHTPHERGTMVVSR
tara:strand:+ start:441 stop:686 length:246 start_codon:yes stop_codon:yes gene_type:complete